MEVGFPGSGSSTTGCPAMRSSLFIPFTFTALILMLPTRPVAPSDVPEKMQLVIDNPMKDKREIERDFIVTEPYTVNQGHLVFEAIEAKTNPSLRTVNSYADCVMEAELVLGSSQKAPVCFTARPSKDQSRSYGFYLYPIGLQYIRLIEVAIEPGTKDLQKHTAPMRMGEPYRVKIRVAGEHLAMKMWPADEEEPPEWQMETRDANLTEAGPLGMEIQRSGTPGGYSAEIRGLKVWASENK